MYFIFHAQQISHINKLHIIASYEKSDSDILSC